MGAGPTFGTPCSFSRTGRFESAASLCWEFQEMTCAAGDALCCVPEVWKELAGLPPAAQEMAASLPGFAFVFPQTVRFGVLSCKKGNAPGWMGGTRIGAGGLRSIGAGDECADQSWGRVAGWELGAARPDAGTRNPGARPPKRPPRPDRKSAGRHKDRGARHRERWEDRRERRALTRGPLGPDTDPDRDWRGRAPTRAPGPVTETAESAGARSRECWAPTQRPPELDTFL